MKKKGNNNRELSQSIISWREWVALPDLGVDFIKVKVDTGARSSSIHALDVQEFKRDGVDWVSFKIHPKQRTREGEVMAQAPILEYRNVRSSNGKVALRPVIETHIRIFETVWSVEVTLANRDAMGFRMLLGREAIRGRFLVDAGRSFLSAKPNSTRTSARKSTESETR